MDMTNKHNETLAPVSISLTQGINEASMYTPR